MYACIIRTSSDPKNLHLTQRQVTDLVVSRYDDVDVFSGAWRVADERFGLAGLLHAVINSGAQWVEIAVICERISCERERLEIHIEKQEPK